MTVNKKDPVLETLLHKNNQLVDQKTPYLSTQTSNISDFPKIHFYQNIEIFETSEKYKPELGIES